MKAYKTAIAVEHHLEGGHMAALIDAIGNGMIGGLLTGIAKRISGCSKKLNRRDRGRVSGDSTERKNVYLEPSTAFLRTKTVYLEDLFAFLRY